MSMPLRIVIWALAVSLLAVAPVLAQDAKLKKEELDQTPRADRALLR